MIVSLGKRMKAIGFILVAFLFIACSRQADPQTRNVIVMMVDGCSTSSLSVARWYRQCVDSLPGNLNMDPYICGLVRTSSAYSPVTGSSESMTAFLSGERTGAGYVSMLPKPGRYGSQYDIDTSRMYQPLATLLELAKVQGKATGMVVTVEYWHATPASTAAHADSRGAQKSICTQIASQDLDVMFGGGVSYVDDEIRRILAENGTTLLMNDREGIDDTGDGRLWALYNDIEMAFELDRDPEKEPSLAEMTASAIKRLSRNKKGFFLMVEGSKVDYAAHANDPAAHIHDLLAFDEACGVALDFAEKDGNTTVVILSDHGTSGMTISRSGYTHYSRRPARDAFGCIPQWKATAQKLSYLISDCDNSQIRQIMKEHTGIDITDEEERILVAHKDRRTEDYMLAQYDATLQGMIARIETSRAYIGYSSAGHTGEDVFLAVYNPKGIRPEGFQENVQICDYLNAVMGHGASMREFTDEIFAKASLLFSGCELQCIEEGGYHVLCVSRDGHELRIPADHSIAYLDGELLKTGTVAVYQKGEFYVNSSLAGLL